MSKDEIQNIKEDIQKSGFPLEIEVSSVLEEDIWEDVILHGYYLDEEEEKSREIDVCAFKRFDLDAADYDHFHISLIIECKKSSDKHWVFYTSKKGRMFKLPHILIKSWGNPPIHKNLVWQEKWMKKSHYFLPKIERKAVIGYEAFTGGKGRKIFEAKMQVIKALAYRLKKDVSLSALGKNYLCLKYPVIVFDGHLFEYTSGNIKPAQYLQFLTGHIFRDPSTREIVGENFLIDVVRRDFLPEYLKMLREELEAISLSFGKFWEEVPREKS